jgi:two-component system sensor histidine kinase PhoQ
MKGLLRHIFPLSLRVRFLLATAGVVLVLSLAYGMVALVGYSVSFDKTTACCAARAISFICWRNGRTALLTSISRKT